MSSGRPDGRRAAELRPLKIETGVSRYAEGSSLVAIGHTKVLCTASIEERVPPFLKNSGTGWVTAEYGMLPRATHTRTQREISRGRADGRTIEIQRLIGRTLRAVTDLKAFGERTVTIDCDVLQADGGTRCAAITGACVALAHAFAGASSGHYLVRWPLRELVAAISVGHVAGAPVLDLAYEEDSRADVDFNVAGTITGKFVELQGTAEREPFSREELDALLDLARRGLSELFAAQNRAIAPAIRDLKIPESQFARESSL